MNAAARATVRHLWIAVLILVSTAAAPAAPPSNWPRWRGPDDNAVVDTPCPVEWDAQRNVAWKTALPGRGCSTPIVWGRLIFVTAPVDGRDALLAYDRDGREQWRSVFEAERPGKHAAGSGCNPSPATDGTTVFAYFKSGTLAALAHDGRLRWKTNLQQRFGPDTLFWDVGTSPAVTASNVVVAVMQGGDSYVVAFDKLSGEQRWKVPRLYDVVLETDHAYTTPIVLTHRGRAGLLIWGAEHLTVHDAADGRVTWSCGGFNPERKTNWPAVASPVLAGGVWVVPYGRGKRLHGVRWDGVGDVTATHRLWMREDTGSYTPTPAFYRGQVVLLHDRETVEGIDPQTGRTLWTGALPPGKAAYYASPMIAGGRLYLAREDGLVAVARVDGPFEILAQNPMGERLFATPVPLDGRLLLRGDKHLFMIAQ